MGFFQFTQFLQLGGKVVSNYFSSPKDPSQRWRIEVKPWSIDNVSFSLRREEVAKEVDISQ